MARSYPIRVILSKRFGMLAALFSLLFLHLVLVLRIFRFVLPCEILPLFVLPLPIAARPAEFFSGSALLVRGPPFRF